MPKKPKAMNCADFCRKQAVLGWQNKKIAERLRVCLSTIEKWRSGAVPIPGTAAALLDAIVKTETRGNRG